MDDDTHEDLLLTAALLACGVTRGDAAVDARSRLISAGWTLDGTTGRWRGPKGSDRPLGQ